MTATAELVVVDEWLTREAVGRELAVSLGYTTQLARTNCWRSQRRGVRVYYLAEDVRRPRPNRRARPLTSPAERIALKVTTYRLSIETARHALRIGRVAEALAVLDEAVQ